MSFILPNISDSLYIEYPWPIEDPPKFLPFQFEDTFVFDGARLWALKNLTLIKGVCFIYFLFAQFGPSMMKDRKALNLQRPLVLWNFLLAIFSIMGAARIWPPFIDVLASPDGLYRTCCLRKGLSQGAAFWAVAFTASKFVELGDTVFLVLRKRKLTFLHWFHHLTMLYCTTICFIEGEAISSWVLLINYSVHSIMYTYFTITALKLKVPKKISMAITSLQLLQFATAIFVNVYSIGVLANGGECARTQLSIGLQVSCGLIYVVLFSKFFYKSYIVIPKKKIE